MDRVFEHVVAAVDRARLLALGERRAVAGRREERADAGAGGADALGQIALRHQLELDLAGAVQTVEHASESTWRGNEQMILRTRRASSSAARPGVAVAGVVVDDGQVAARLARSARRCSSAGMPGRAEAADHDRGAVGDTLDGGGSGCHDLVDHERSSTR